MLSRRCLRPGRRHSRRAACTRLVLGAAALLSAALACGASTVGRGAPDRLRVLFIGNSLTYVNDLPSTIKAVAEASGRGRLEYKVVALPDYGLEEHWNQGDARRLLAEGGWDVVVLQQGPSASEQGRATLLKYARLFSKEIARVGARPAFYMVWPARGRLGDFDRSNESYAMAARENMALLIPVGEAWREAWRRDASLRLYAPDDFHPSPAGSYLAALVFCAELFGRSTRTGLDARTLAALGLTSQQAETLRAAADAATTARHPVRP